MTQESHENQLRRYLAAFADGELDVEQTLEVLDQLIMDPDATNRVVHQQQLRDAVARVIRSQTPQTPKDLKTTVGQLAEHEPAPRYSGQRTVAGRIGRWSPIAAVLLIGAFLGSQFIGTSNVADADDRILTDAHVKKFTLCHVVCTRKTQKLPPIPRMPDNIQALPGPLEDYLGTPLTVDSMDLSLLGYTYQAAGECPVPGGRAVHLVYEAAPETGRQDSVSLWVEVYTGTPKLDQGRVYHVNSNDAAHPFLVWRKGNLAYYLIGDSAKHTQDVLERLAKSDS